MSTKIWFDKLADGWINAMPLGNGRVGAMFYGNPDREIIEINEESLWSGRQLKEKNPASPDALEKIRSLIFENRLEEAVQISRETFLSDPPRVRFYESFGEITVDFADKSEFVDYRKELELSEAVASACWKKGTARYRSECFVSEKYDALLYRVETDGEPFSCDVTMKRGRDAYTSAISDKMLVLNGRVTFPTTPLHGEWGEGISFGARIHIDTDGKTEERVDHIAVTDATYVTVYGGFATNYNVEIFNFDENTDYRAALNACMDKLARAEYKDIRAEHIRSHRAWFESLRFELDAPDHCDEPTYARLNKARTGEREDPDLYTLYYYFGRYLLNESSGKRARLPANLQGIWCSGFRPAWGSDYHTNINLQMNYWPAETGNCSEAVGPLIYFMKRISEFGTVTARENFGARGWCINHTTDVFGRTGVHDSGDCGFFPMAGPWMCLSLWEHYEFTNDIEYLREVYPILRGACLFLLDYLTEAPNGYLTTAPSNSPENRFFYQHPDGERRHSMITHGATIDFEIIYALFTRTVYACETLGDDKSFAAELGETLKRLPPLRVSERYGTVCEWIEDYEETEPGHRHCSHLFGLYPSDQINETEPDIYEAAKRTIARRIQYGEEGSAGCGKVGWSQAWMVNFYARLKDGENALSRIDALLCNCTKDNLFDIHPPSTFQIDGNLGGAAGIAEMLIQSHLGVPDNRIIELLPALPKSWKGGGIYGVKARGGFTVNIEWRDGCLTRAEIVASDDRMLRVKMPRVDIKVTAASPYSVNGGILECPMRRGETVILETV